MSKIIFAFTGLLASGKDTAVHYFIEKYGAASVKFSQPLRDALDRFYVPHARGNMQDLSTFLRERFGQDILSRAIAKDAAALDASVVVINGVRRLSDIEHLQSLNGFCLVAIKADQKIRHRRLVARKENPDDGEKTWEQFCSDERAEAEIQIPEVMQGARETIDNNGTRDELFVALDSLYQRYAQG